MKRLALLAAISVIVFLAGCGDDSNGGAEAPEKTEQAEKSPPEPELKPKSYRNQVADCVSEVAFETRGAGNALRIESPGGRLIANVQTFSTPAEAETFAAQVEVDHAYGGKGVAIWLKDAGDDERSVVTDCLTP